MADDELGPPAAFEDRMPPVDGAVAARRRSGKAIAALVCGIISLFVLGVVLGVAAVALGILARSEIRADPGLEGDGMALAGIITGALGALLAVVLIALGVGFAI